MPTTTERTLNLRPWEVPGLLDGTKTRVSRVVKPQPRWCAWTDCWIYPVGGTGYEPLKGETFESWIACRSPFGVPGDLLVCKETTAFTMPLPSPPGAEPKRLIAGYLADKPSTGDFLDDPWWDEQTWVPPQRVPRWASRLTLEVQEVGVQRVQEMTLADLRAEAIPLEPDHLFDQDRAHYMRAALASAKGTWDAHASPGERWEDNPWVWFAEVRRA